VLRSFSLAPSDLQGMSPLSLYTELELPVSVLYVVLMRAVWVQLQQWILMDMFPQSHCISGAHAGSSLWGAGRPE
jgi:hypothetical protein